MKTRTAINTLGGRVSRVPKWNRDLRSARRQSGFTMVEIAISIGVIAFALVAIIGILPTGLQTQRDNREDTLVNQDARVILEAIKSGGRDVTSDIGTYVLITNTVPTPGGIPITNLVQLLCDTTRTNTVVMSSMAGAVVSRGSDLGFKYEIRSLVTPSDLGGTMWSGTNGPVGFEVRLRFAWPVVNDTVNADASTYIVRAMITGYRDPNNGLIYAQEYR